MADTKHNLNGSFVRSLDAIDRCIAGFEAFLLTASILLIATNTIANVISRFFFDHSIIFAEELNSILILVTTFAGLGYAARLGRHIRMSAIYDAMAPPVRKCIMTLITAVTALLLFALSYYAVAYIASIYPQGRIMPALGIPVYLVYLWVPAGFFFSGIQYAMAAYKNMTGTDIFVSSKLRQQDLQEEAN